MNKEKDIIKAEVSHEVKYESSLSNEYKSIVNMNNNISREEKIQTLCDTTRFEEEQLKQMTKIELNMVWDRMETTDWLNDLDVESVHEI